MIGQQFIILPFVIYILTILSKYVFNDKMMYKVYSVLDHNMVDIIYFKMSLLILFQTSRF